MELLDTLKHRFEKHRHRHKAITWAQVLARHPAPGSVPSPESANCTLQPRLLDKPPKR